jgi:erythronate-4-phosphate dehydrogenase
LLKNVLIVTPHIAGYSYEGKVNGTKMVYDSLCNFLNINTFEFEVQSNSIVKIDRWSTIEFSLNELISKIYSIKNDDNKMRRSYVMNLKERLDYFDLQRKNYPVRREFNNYQVSLQDLDDKIKNILTTLRFNVS